VKNHGGYVSGVIGDSMLALWAATSSEAVVRQRACIAAVDIMKELELFFESAEFPRINTRIGLHCGHILLGHIGALDHYEYTPIGDIVNTASRIEGLNKVLGTGTLVSGEVINQLVGFLSRELGRFKVAGKIKPVVVHELLGRLKECDALKRNLCEGFAGARETFRRRSWDEAIEKFQQIITKFGEDGPSRFYLKLSEDYKENPPEEPWDEVIRTEKR
jgi:adenylate cyclase